MTPEKKEQQKMKKMKIFVSAARDIIEEEGFENLSIRRIAEKAGFHNSTIYFYFSDADLLIALASVRSIADYSRELAILSRQTESDYDSFFHIWYFFCRYSFARPHLFHQFFFGKYKDNLTDILNQYYEMFPEEKLEYSRSIEGMYYAPTFRDRCLHILRPLADLPETRIDEKNLDMANDIIICTFQGLLEKARSASGTDCDALTSRFLDMLHFLVDAR